MSIPVRLHLLSLCVVSAMEATLHAAPPTRPDTWAIEQSGTAICDWASGPARGCDMDMHGQHVMLHIALPASADAEWKMDLGWPILRGASDLRGGIVGISRNDLPAVSVDGTALPPPVRRGYRYDGVLSVLHRAQNGVELSCAVFPSVTHKAVIEQWTVENLGGEPVRVEVPSSRKTLGEPVDAMGQPSLLERTVTGIEQTQLAKGQKVTYAILYTLRRAADPPVAVDPAREKEARQAMFRKARETLALETPEPLLKGTFVLAKMRLLEAPVDSVQGLIQGTGTKSYLGGVWANDNVEYASPVCPYLGDATLVDACNNMYQIWLGDKSPRISPSYETYRLRPIGHDRGDQAMMLYGLSSYLLALGDRATAERFWPLVEKSAGLTKAATTKDGVVASRTDELEGRYPTGTANLSTSSLAYGGYRAASRLARSLGKMDESKDHAARADALARAIESYFGAEVEGYRTYRYFAGCDVLRGWILLPPTMGIVERKDATIQALFSPKLWFEDPARHSAGAKVASSDRGGGWPRETYYALRAAFKAGHTQLALEKTLTAVRCAMLGPQGPYLDEDGGDLLSPSALYVSVIVEGLFGIEPQSMDAFTCTLRLPKGWPSMRLSNVCMMGRRVDLFVERTGQEVRLTVSHGGKTIFSKTGADGTVCEVGLTGTARH